MKVSLIIPVYNSTRKIKKLLESIVAQTILDDTEVIIVDDCSTDNIVEVLDKYKIPNLIYLKNDVNIGPGESRQRGIDNSTGDVIMFADSDDVLVGSKSLETRYNYIVTKNKPYGIYQYISNNNFYYGHIGTLVIERKALMDSGVRFDPYLSYHEEDTNFRDQLEDKMGTIDVIHTLVYEKITYFDHQKGTLIEDIATRAKSALYMMALRTEYNLYDRERWVPIFTSVAWYALSTIATLIKNNDITLTDFDKEHLRVAKNILKDTINTIDIDSVEKTAKELGFSYDINIDTLYVLDNFDTLFE